MAELQAGRRTLGGRGKRRRRALAQHAVGDGRRPVRDDDGVLDADADHAAVPARARRQERRPGSTSGPASSRGVTSFVAAFASPVWGRVADQHGRKLMLLRSSLAIGFFTVLMGLSRNVWQFFARADADGHVRRVFRVGDRAGREPGAGVAARLFAGLAVDRAAGRLAGRPDHRRRARRSDRQLPHPVLPDLGDDLCRAGLGVVRRARGVRAAANRQGRPLGHRRASSRWCARRPCSRCFSCC